MMIKKFIVVICCFASVTSFSQKENITLMTYNIRLDVASDKENAWPNRKEGLVNQLEFYEPSIFGIQEGLPRQVDYLKENLPTYGQFGIGRNGEGKGEASSIFYKKDRFEVIQSNTFWLSSTPGIESIGWDAALPRICTYGLFKEKETGNQFWVLNTHFDHLGVESRLMAIDLILEKINTINIENFPVIFMGDLNVEPDSAVISKLNTYMTDALEASENSPFGSYGTFNGFKFHEVPNKRIDYVYVSNSNNIRVLKHAVLTDSKDLKYYSDHFPVYIELVIN